MKNNTNKSCVKGHFDVVKFIGMEYCTAVTDSLKFCLD